MNDHYRKLIANEFEKCVINTIKRISSKKMTYRPFHSALLSEDVIYWSSFERSFSTSFGQRVIEELARLVALSNGADEACRQKETFISIDTAYEDAIQKHLKKLRNNKTSYAFDWGSSLNEVQDVVPTGKFTDTIRIISDVWWKKDGIEHFLSLKTVKPNIDQTVVAKEDCLHLAVALPDSKTYFGLPYNPYGEDRKAYAFYPPMNIFDFHNDSVVLIGKDLWDTIGGSGCYDEIIDIASEVGARTKLEIDASQKSC